MIQKRTGYVALVVAMAITLLMPAMVSAQPEENDSVGLTAVVAPIVVQVEVDPDAIDYGTIKQGQESDVYDITITNVGDLDATVTASTDAPFYQNSLQLEGEGGTPLSPEWQSVDDWYRTVPNEPLVNAETAGTKLVVAPDEEPGAKTGTLIIYAEAAE